MRISFNTNIQNKIKTNKTNFKSNIFVGKPSFRSVNDDRSYTEFDKWARETDFKKIIIEVVKDPKNQKGTDSDGYVYTIPNCDKWILKKHKQTSLYPRQVSETEYSEVTDIAPRMNIGQKIASVWVPVTDRTTSHFFVHKNQGDSKVQMSKMIMNSVSAFSSKVHLESLSKLANLPQKSYDKLAQEVKFITEKGFYFDSDGINKINVDSDKNEINILGLVPNNTDKKSQHTEVLYALLGGDFTDKFNKSHRPDSEKTTARGYSDVITKKYISAVSNLGDKFENTKHFAQLLSQIRRNL